MSARLPRAARPASSLAAVLVLAAALTATAGPATAATPTTTAGPSATATPTSGTPTTGGPPIGGAELATTTTVVQVPVGVPAPPEMPAKGYLLADLTSGQILVAHDVHRPMLTASTMKVLTALTLLPRLDPQAVYTATRADADIDGSKVGIVAGSTYTSRQLFLGMMLSSGNDAANALANAAGGVPATVDLMQQEATSLGAFDTAVRDPSGLDSPGQRSSPYDLALIARAAMQRPDFRALVATKTATFPGGIVKGKRGRGFQIQNHNELLSHYPGAIGVKTGYTEAAKWTYIGAARRGSHTYLVTEMGLSQAGWLPATRLLDWAFAHGTQATPVGRLVTAADLVTRASSPGASPGNGSDALSAGAAVLSSSSNTTRLVGFAGLAAAAVIVGGLGLGAARRRSGPR